MCVDALQVIPASRRLIAGIKDKLPPFWTFQATEEKGSNTTDVTLTGAKLVYGRKDVVVFARSDEVSLVCANLARLYRGGHGGVLSSQEDVCGAFQKLRSLLDQISHCGGPPLWKLRSIELGWNIGQRFRDVEAVALSSQTSWVRNPLDHTRGRKVTFNGENVKAKFYNKALIMYRCNELADPNWPISRVEFTLRGKKLKEVIGAGTFVPEAYLSFANLKRWFFDCVRSFENAVPIHAEVPTSIPERLLYGAAVMGIDGQRIHGMTPFEFAVHKAPPSTRRYWKKKYDGMVISVKGRRVIDFFPESDLGEPVECGDLLQPRPHSSPGVPFRFVFEAWRKIEDDEDDDEAAAAGA